MRRKLLIFLLGSIAYFVIMMIVMISIFEVHPLTGAFRVLITFMLFTISLFLVWSLRPMSAPESMISMLAGEHVSFKKGQFGYILRPESGCNECGVIFYPGGRVTPLAYLPLLLEMTNEGYLVYICSMPFNLAVMDYRRALRVQKEIPGIKKWIIGGHSLGGAMAAHLICRAFNQFDALFLWGAYPSHRDKLTSLEQPILVIYGTCDGITTIEMIEKSRHLFPEHTRWEKLEGGNHAQFGCYGEEKEDQQAHISAHTQHNFVSRLTLDFLQENKTC